MKKKERSKGLILLISLIVAAILAILSIGTVHVVKYANDNGEGSGTGSSGDTTSQSTGGESSSSSATSSEPTTHTQGDIHYYLSPLMDSSYVSGEMLCVCIKLSYNGGSQMWEAVDVAPVYNDKQFIFGEDQLCNHDGYDSGNTAHDMSWPADTYEKMFTLEASSETESDIFMLTAEQKEHGDEIDRADLAFYKLNFCSINNDHVIDETQVGDFLSEYFE